MRPGKFFFFVLPAGGDYPHRPSKSGQGRDGLPGGTLPPVAAVHPLPDIIGAVWPSRLDRPPVHRHLHVSLMAIVI